MSTSPLSPSVSSSYATTEFLFPDPPTAMHPPHTPGFPLNDGSLARFDALVSMKDDKESWAEKVKTGSGGWCVEWRKKYTLVELSGMQIEIAQADKMELTAHVLDDQDQERIADHQRQISSRKGSWGIGGAPVSSDSFKVTYTSSQADLATFSVDGSTHRVSELFETVEGKHTDLAKKLEINADSPVSTVMTTKARGFLIGATIYLVHVDLIPVERPWSELNFPEETADTDSPIEDCLPSYPSEKPSSPSASAAAAAATAESSSPPAEAEIDSPPSPPNKAVETSKWAASAWWENTKDGTREAWKIWLRLNMIPI